MVTKLAKTKKKPQKRKKNNKDWRYYDKQYKDDITTGISLGNSLYKERPFGATPDGKKITKPKKFKKELDKVIKKSNKDRKLAQKKYKKETGKEY